MMVFCNFLEIKAETKKVVGVKVVPFWVLYSCVKFRRLKMGDPVYTSVRVTLEFILVNNVTFFIEKKRNMFRKSRSKSNINDSWHSNRNPFSSDGH